MYSENSARVLFSGQDSKPWLLDRIGRRVTVIAYLAPVQATKWDAVGRRYRFAGCSGRQSWSLCCANGSGRSAPGMFLQAAPEAHLITIILIRKEILSRLQYGIGLSCRITRLEFWLLGQTCPFQVFENMQKTCDLNQITCEVCLHFKANPVFEVSP